MRFSLFPCLRYVETQCVFHLIAGVTLLSVVCTSCGPLGTPLRPLGPAPYVVSPAAESPQGQNDQSEQIEQLERFNTFLERA